MSFRIFSCGLSSSFFFIRLCVIKLSFHLCYVIITIHQHTVDPLSAFLMMIVISFLNCFRASNSSGDKLGLNIYFLSFCIISLYLYQKGEQKKQVSMIRKYHNHKPQKTPWHREKSRSTITKHQEDKLSKATSSLFPIKMISILEWT